MKKITLLVLSLIVASTVIFVGCKKEETKTNVGFNNKTFTPITITCNSESKTIAVNSSVTFYDVKGSSVTYTAETKGTTSGGSQVGLTMQWNSSVALSGGSASTDLVISGSYFYLYITNTGLSDLYDLYVNYGLTSQTYDNVTFAHSHTTNPTYETGYYNAWTNSNVKLYYVDAVPPPSIVMTMTAYQGTNFTLPFTQNQSATISFNPSEKSIACTTTSHPLTKGTNVSVATAVQ